MHESYPRTLRIQDMCTKVILGHLRIQDMCTKVILGHLGFRICAAIHISTVRRKQILRQPNDQAYVCHHDATFSNIAIQNNRGMVPTLNYVKKNC